MRHDGWTESELGEDADWFAGCSCGWSSAHVDTNEAATALLMEHYKDRPADKCEGGVASARSPLDPKTVVHVDGGGTNIAILDALALLLGVPLTGGPADAEIAEARALLMRAQNALVTTTSDDAARAASDAGDEALFPRGFAEQQERRLRATERLLDEAVKQRQEFKELGQRMEREKRETFEQSCKNLARAEAAEAALEDKLRMHNKGACDLMLQELKRRVEEAEALLREASDLVENVEIVVPYDCRERNALIRKIDVLLAAVRK